MSDAPASPTTTAVFTGLPDLAGALMGGEALISSDAFFAGHENLLHPHEPVWDAARYTERGKWMDGWEPRRRRHPGHDWAIVRLGCPGDLVGVDIDTRHFLGNHAPYASLDATVAPADASPEWLRDHATWTPVLEQTLMGRGGHNVFALTPFAGATHVRLNIYPAGGVARLRVFGRPLTPKTDARIDLVNARNGGRALACSDMFFSRMDNLLRPDEAVHMGDGWETKRSPIPKRDWVILALGQPGHVDEICVHTRHFKGNYPTGVCIQALHWPDAPPHALSLCDDWTVIVPDHPLGPDRGHDIPVAQPGPWTHLKIIILSDGGISRVRAWGRPATQSPGLVDPLVRGLNEMPEAEARAALTRCCGAGRWVDGMLAGRPYASRTHLHGHARHVWWHLGDGDWREAFEHHPRIGADPATLRAKFAATADWSAGEQAGVAGADDAVIEALAEGNRAYEERFGHIFIVCASGLTAAQMLARLQARINNAPENELRIAAGEQVKITALRLEKLGADLAASKGG